MTYTSVRIGLSRNTANSGPTLRFSSVFQLGSMITKRQRSRHFKAIFSKHTLLNSSPRKLCKLFCMALPRQANTDSERRCLWALFRGSRQRPSLSGHPGSCPCTEEVTGDDLSSHGLTSLNSQPTGTRRLSTHKQVSRPQASGARGTRIHRLSAPRSPRRCPPRR